MSMESGLRSQPYAARAARETAVRTNTAIVVERDKKPVRITAEELRRASSN
jgi:hypothetical protein